MSLLNPPTLQLTAIPLRRAKSLPARLNLATKLDSFEPLPPSTQFIPEVSTGLASPAKAPLPAPKGRLRRAWEATCQAVRSLGSRIAQAATKALGWMNRYTPQRIAQKLSLAEMTRRINDPGNDPAFDCFPAPHAPAIAQITLTDLNRQETVLCGPDELCFSGTPGAGLIAFQTKFNDALCALCDNDEAWAKDVGRHLNQSLAAVQLHGLSIRGWLERQGQAFTVAGKPSLQFTVAQKKGDPNVVAVHAKTVIDAAAAFVVVNGDVKEDLFGYTTLPTTFSCDIEIRRGVRHVVVTAARIDSDIPARQIKALRYA
jgi:hypothetical protein